MTYEEKIYDLAKSVFRDASINQMSFDIMYDRGTGEVYTTQSQLSGGEYLFTIPADNDQGWIDSNDDASVEEQFDQAFEEGNFREWFYEDLWEEAHQNFDGLDEIEDAEYHAKKGL